MSKILYSYPRPEQNQNCLCQNSMQAMFCQTGHMLECHSGMNCDTARCSHLPKYGDGMSNYTVQNAPVFLVSCFGKPNERLELRHLLDMMIYAPEETEAVRCFEEWISGTEQLSKIALDIRVRPATADDFENMCLCGHRLNQHSPACKSCSCKYFGRAHRLPLDDNAEVK